MRLFRGARRSRYSEPITGGTRAAVARGIRGIYSPRTGALIPVRRPENITPSSHDQFSCPAAPAHDASSTVEKLRRTAPPCFNRAIFILSPSNPCSPPRSNSLRPPSRHKNRIQARLSQLFPVIYKCQATQPHSLRHSLFLPIRLPPPRTTIVSPVSSRVRSWPLSRRVLIPLTALLTSTLPGDCVILSCRRISNQATFDTSTLKESARILNTWTITGCE